MRSLRLTVVVLVALAALLAISQPEGIAATFRHPGAGYSPADASAGADTNASGVDGEGAAAEASAPLRIGLLFPYTGALSIFGPALENGANLAANHINAAGGVLGQPIEIVTGDTATDPPQGVSEATRLIDVEGVSAIVGAVSSGVTLPVAESVTIPNQIVQISPASTSPAITTVNDDDYLFRTAPSDAWQGRALGALAAEQGFATACTLYINNAYGQGLSDEFTQSFEALGGQVLAAVPHEDEQATYLSELMTCTAGSPDVLAAISFPSSAEVFLVEAIQNALVDNFLFVDGTKSQDMIDAVEAAVGPGALDGMFGTAGGGEISALLAAEYEAEYGEPPPLPFIGEAYSAVALLALAAERAGSTDSTAIRDALRHVTNPRGIAVPAGSVGIAQALGLIRAAIDVNYLGHAGVLDLDFDINGDVTTAAVEVWTIEAGQIETVRVDYLRPSPDVTCMGIPANVVGTASGELLVGTPGTDVIIGLGGNDLILGLSGNDLVCAGDGNDLVAGGGGHDRILGQSGGDILAGGPGFDVCAGGGGTDMSFGCELAFGVP